MSAICGVLSFGAQRRPRTMCQAMLEAQIRLGPHRQSIVAQDDVAFGHALYRLTPEDAYDEQPAVGKGPYLIAADIRLDNRDSLIAELGFRGRDPETLSDSEIFLSAYERWEEGTFARLVGVFAIAVWDSKRRTLLLARDPTAQRPIHYHAGNGFFAFASLPMGLHALSEVDRAPNEERLAAFVAETGSDGIQTFYKDISRVQGGHFLVATSSGIRTHRFWDPPRDYLRLGRHEDYVQAYREQLDQAVRSRLRGAGGLVGAHLSSGMDSSAVTATAARLMAPSGGRVLAFTAAPRQGYDLPASRGRIADESKIAAEAAAWHDNVEHIIVRPKCNSILSDYASQKGLFQQPFYNTCNSLWWRAINAEAKSRNVSVMLSGSAGNLTLSAGGLPQLADLVRDRRWLRWWMEASKLVRGGSVKWRGVLAASLGPWTPRPVWKAVSVAFLGASSRLDTDFLVGPYWREKLTSRDSPVVREFRPPKDSRAIRILKLQTVDPGVLRKEALVRWGVDERDPTADQRLAEFCLALPPEMLLSQGLARPLARRALADRLPSSVLNNRLRGEQLADWHERIGPADAAAMIERTQECEAVRRVINVDRVRELIRDWPAGGWERRAVFTEYRHSLLRALTAAHFLHHASCNQSDERLQSAETLMLP